MLAVDENKYKPNPENNGTGHIVPSEDTDLYCYIMIILNYLYGDRVNNMSIEEFYEYMTYLSKIGVHKELLNVFEKIVSNCHNDNPGYLLDSLSEETIYRSHIKVYEKAKSRLM